VPRWALEHHFGHGKLAVAARQANFQRIYDLPERVIPADLLQREPAEPDARRELLAQAARAFGIATSRDLADYYRMSPREAAPRLAELAESGIIRPVSVDGWNETAWLADSARLPRTIDANALLSPFDPLIWFRPRSERLFDFHNRIAIYGPARLRKWGYYVLPFLCGERIAARVDLKADRATRRLLVQASHLEEGADGGVTAERLAVELKSLADWLDLTSVAVARRGAFARILAAAMQKY
jgi:uncharacterized protein YcaQ